MHKKSSLLLLDIEIEMLVYLLYPTSIQAVKNFYLIIRRRSKVKKIVACLMALEMVLALTACGGSSSSTGSTAAAKAAAAATTAKAAAATTAATTAKAAAGATTTAAATAAANIKKGGAVTFGLSSDCTTAAAWRLRSYQEQAEWSAVYEPLFRMDSKGAVVPYLAKSLNSDPDKLTYTVTLRDDVTFSDGSKLDADVLLWNFENFKKNSQTSSTHFGDVDSFEKKDASTVVIHMKEWSSQIPYSLTNVAGLMYSKKAFDDNGGADWAAKNPVGTGPYKLSEWTKDDNKVLVKNDKYWNKNSTASFDKITFKVISDEMSAQAALISNTIDGYFNGSYDLINTMTKQNFKCDYPAGNFRIIFLIYGSDVQGDPLCDVKVRQAIAYAIDSDSIVKNLDYGITWNSKEYAVKDTIFWNDDVAGYKYDPEKAKALLKEAGYENGFKTKLSVGKDQALDRYMVAVQGYLKAVGIDVTLDYQETAVWTSTGIYKTDGGMILAGHGFGYNLVNQMASNFSKRAVAGVGMLKDSSIHPDDLDKVIMAALRAKDTETMLKNEKEAEKMIIDTYCLGYPVAMGSAASFVYSSKIEEKNGVDGTDTYFDWNNIHLK
jgi:peptide/nickel transport system substrate-binding protein